MLKIALQLFGTGVITGLVIIVVTGLRCMSRPGITPIQTRLTALHTFIGASLFIFFFLCVVAVAIVLGPPIS